MVTSKAQNLKEQNASAHRVWSFLKKVVETLGPEGMSSDESDVEDNAYVFRFFTKRMPWRKDLTAEFRTIDAEWIADVKLRGTSNRRVPRARNSAAPVTTRKPRSGLPQSFYDRQYLDSLDEQELQVIEPKEVTFRWLHV